MKRLKASIVQIKSSIKEYNLNEGVLQNTLFSCNYMKKGRHHLFDEIENNKQFDESNLEDEFYKSMKLVSSSNKKVKLHDGAGSKSFLKS